LGAAAMLVASALCAQTTDSARYRRVEAWGGAVAFEVAREWHVLREDARDSSGFFIYHVRNPASDSGPERTNVLVLPRATKATGNFRKFTDSTFRTVSADVQIILDDRMPTPDRRALFWRGQLNATPYIGFDNYARAGKYWVHVRIVSPLVSGTTREWTEAFYRDAEALVRSVRLNGRQVMNDDTGFPVVMGSP
jgi:hypothetical protein